MSTVYWEPPKVLGNFSAFSDEMQKSFCSHSGVLAYKVSSGNPDSLLDSPGNLIFLVFWLGTRIELGFHFQERRCKMSSSGNLSKEGGQALGVESNGVDELPKQPFPLLSLPPGD